MNPANKTVLFLCTGNSCRSQMAEGWAKKYWKEKLQIFSAGTKKSILNLNAVEVMKEKNVDISNQYSKTTDEINIDKFDYVFTLCSDAQENCPIFPGGKVIHVGFDDPPSICKDLNDNEIVINVYRRVRDEIETFVKEMDKYFEK